jgi:hypothetical protein
MRASAARRGCHARRATHQTRIIRRARRRVSDATTAWTTINGQLALAGVSVCAWKQEPGLLSSQFAYETASSPEKQNEKEIVGSLNVELVKRYDSPAFAPPSLSPKLALFDDRDTAASRQQLGLDRTSQTLWFDAIDPTATLVAAHPHRIAAVPPLLREERPMLRPATQVRLLDHGPLNPSWPWR